MERALAVIEDYNSGELNISDGNESGDHNDNASESFRMSTTSSGYDYYTGNEEDVPSEESEGWRDCSSDDTPQVSFESNECSSSVDNVQARDSDLSVGNASSALNTENENEGATGIVTESEEHGLSELVGNPGSSPESEYVVDMRTSPDIVQESKISQPEDRLKEKYNAIATSYRIAANMILPDIVRQRLLDAPTAIHRLRFSFFLFVCNEYKNIYELG